MDVIALDNNDGKNVHSEDEIEQQQSHGKNLMLNKKAQYTGGLVLEPKKGEWMCRSNMNVYITNNR